MNKQQEYIEKLKEISAVPIQVTNLEFKQKSKDFKPGRRYNIGKYQIHDERTILLNEVVFDFDWSSWKRNYSKAKLVLEALDARSIPYYIYSTGGKGIHIHIYFKKLDIQLKEYKKIFQEAFSYGYTWKAVRLWLWNKILDEAGIETRERGVGKNKVDKAVVSFNYFTGSPHLIRDCGGRKKFKNHEDEFITRYKTYLTLSELTSKKICIDNFDNAKFPDVLKTFEIDIPELCQEMSDYIKQAEKRQDVKQDVKYARVKFLELDGVQKIIDGLGIGKRSLGALVLAVACKLDKKTKKESIELMNEYVDNCSQVGHRFTSGEAEMWLDWVFNNEYTFWSCSQLKDLELHDENQCQFCQYINKEALEMLESTNLLKNVKEILDIEIVGESDIKILIFLLLLSKDFPSETGKPDWNIIGDPMAQNVILASDSSSGKTYIAKRILKLFGKEGEDYFVVSRLSKNALNYYTERNMDNKIIFIEEMQGLDENTSQLRVWMSEGKLSFDTVEKAKNDEGIEVNTLVTKTTIGQPSFVTCQAEGTVEDQLNNRSWVLSLDVSTNQTKKILEYQSEVNKGNVTTDKTKIRTLKDALKQLKPYHFIIPYVDYELMNIPTEDVRARRDFQKFLTLIKCSAYLHQKQREITIINEQEYLVCNIEDYDIARQYSHSVLGATFSGLTINQINLINYIKNSSWKAEFSIQDIQRNFGKSKTHWRGELGQLENLGYLSSEKTPGKSSIYCLNEEKSINIIQLPPGIDLKVNMKKEGGLKVKNSKVGKSSENFREKKHNISEIHFQVNPQNKREIEKADLKKKPLSHLEKNYFKNKKVFSNIIQPSTFTLENIENYIKSQNEHLIYIDNIVEHFGKENQIKVDTAINILKERGTIYEPKPGRVMLL